MADTDPHLFVKKDATHYYGSLKHDAVSLAGDIDPVDVGQIPNTSAVVIEFGTSADGRGFSLARHVRNRLDFQGELIASGALIPDQLVAAFACGIDAVLVTTEQQAQYGLHNWLDAASGMQRTHYWAVGLAGVRPAWSERTR